MIEGRRCEAHISVPHRPNIVFIIADDVGYAACFILPIHNFRAHLHGAEGMP